jgi:hypothetical protein
MHVGLLFGRATPDAAGDVVVLAEPADDADLEGIQSSPELFMEYASAAIRSPRSRPK